MKSVSLKTVSDADLTAATQEFANAMEAARGAAAKVAEFAALHLRENHNTGDIVRRTIGNVRRGQGSSEYGRRVDILLAQALSLNPTALMRARDQRRQRSRFGASHQAQDMAVEAIMSQVRGAR